MKGGYKMKKIFILVLLILVLSAFPVMAKGKSKSNLQLCDESENLFGYKLSKNSGYETYTYFSPVYEYLGMEQYDGEGNVVIDTFEGVC
jgi:hypothetical protein